MERLTTHKYLPVLTKLMHLWREKAVQIHLTWAGLFGAGNAAFCAKVPPKCIRADGDTSLAVSATFWRGR
eukprot:2256338-Pyramimonas_sp.AAC.1